MAFLLNPNVAYVLLVMGFMIAVLALFSPGTGLLEVGAIFALFLAGYSIANQPVNWWAFGLLAIGFFPFILSLRMRVLQTRRILIGLATLAFLAGSAFLFRNLPGQPGVNLLLVVIMSSLAIGLTWFLAQKSLEAIEQRPTFDLDRLVGMTGQVVRDIQGEGAIYANGETWTARSSQFLPTGSTVRIVGRNGLFLTVEPLQAQPPSSELEAMKPNASSPSMEE